MKFISPDIIHRYLRKLGCEALDIEFNENFEDIRASDKAYIIWNPYGFLAYNRPIYKKKYELYKELQKKGKPTYIVERGALPNSIFIDKNGFLCESSSYNEKNWNSPLNNEQLQKVDNYIKEITEDNTSLESQNSKRLNKEDFFNNLNLDKKYDKIVFIPMQVHNDTVIQLWSDWILNMKCFKDFIYELSEIFPNTLFLVKNHPNEENPNYLVKEEQSNLKIVDNLHYKDCIKYSNKVLTINSGIGLQSMMWNKPVGIVGKAFYQFKDINYKLNNKEEVYDFIDYGIEPNMNKVKSFIYYLRFVFYSVCFMQKISKRASKPTLFETINYEDVNGKRVSINKEVQSEPIVNVLLELIKILPNYCLMKRTCYDCIRFCSLETDKKNLYIGIDMNDKIHDILLENGYTMINNNEFIKNDITIHFEDMPEKTKIMSIYGEEVNVPIPVIKYLDKLYGANSLKQPIDMKHKQPKIAYTTNLYGWAFEFESLYYQKYSKLNVVSMLEKDLKKTYDLDIAMIPSAWHYRDLERDGTINHLKQNGTKIIAQYNSHIPTELDHRISGADLVIVSSEKLYKQVKEKHGFNNLIFLPHFVDCAFFRPYEKYNNGKIGWVGNFKNIYKRPHIVEQIKYPVELQAKYKESLSNHGKQEGMTDFYNSIDILLVTSKSEGSPMTILEAMACGKCVISTDVGIASLVLNPEFIVHEFEGEEQLIKEFNRKLKILKDAPDITIKEGLRNREFVQRYFDWRFKYPILDRIHKQLLENNILEIKHIAENYVRKIKERK